mmetsp:Transcript_16875/g.38682  ORF Transcript_16875/g.38682 Transcript_16875/m.38682 type:complete len:650 (+) Transcript_16875:2568-4517(+)
MSLHHYSPAYPFTDRLVAERPSVRFAVGSKAAPHSGAKTSTARRSHRRRPRKRKTITDVLFASQQIRAQTTRPTAQTNPPSSAPPGNTRPPRFGLPRTQTESLPQAGPDQLYLKAYYDAFYNGPHHSSGTQKRKYRDDHADPSWKTSLPSTASLCRADFGRPDINHSFTQEACFETVVLQVLKRIDFLDGDSVTQLYHSHPLIPHMARMLYKLADYDFRWVRNVPKDWATEDPLNNDRIMALTAALLHFDNNVSMLMRWLGNNFTGSYRNVERTIDRIRPYVDDDLLPHLTRVLAVGCPHHFNAETTRDNAIQYWRHGNNPSVNKKLDQVLRTMRKEARNQYVIPVAGWLWRFVPHLFYSPQHILEKPGKKDRQIFDASFCLGPRSIPINGMTSTPNGSEFACLFGDVLLRLLTRIWNLRISYPDTDIAIHASDVKSCFRQLKHAPDVMGAFSYIIDGVLYLSCGLTFGADFSPPNWEIPRRVLEQLAEGLFADQSLRQKHRKYLDMLTWEPSLGHAKRPFTPAKRDTKNTGVQDSAGADAPTPHDMYVDDDVYADIYQQDHARLEQAIAAGIEAIFIILGRSASTNARTLLHGTNSSKWSSAISTGSWEWRSTHDHSWCALRETMSTKLSPFCVATGTPTDDPTPLSR